VSEREREKGKRTKNIERERERVERGFKKEERTKAKR